MSKKTTIEIDLEVYKAIEARRIDFREPQNLILRRMLSLDAERGRVPEVFRPERRSGSYLLRIEGVVESFPTAKNAYKAGLTKLAANRPDFFGKLADLKMRSRRIVAKSPSELYISSPHLAENFAEKLTPTWWVDLNLSRSQIESRLALACEIVDLKYGKDVVLEYPN